ncbi:MAG TPA: LuxR C-terminal-related transcriptional regulator [Mycobacteriales bacterium]
MLVERDGLVDQLRGARGRFVAVLGEAGAGKTMLVQAALPDAAWGWCEPLATPRPLGPFRDVARALWPGEPELGVPELRERLLDTRAPLVVEDAHWVDEASADVLRFLGRRVAAYDGLVVVTARDELAADHPLRRVLGDLGTAVTRLEVPPLSPAAVASLVDGVDPAEAYRLTGGNAFLVSQLAGDRVAASVRDSVAARVARLGPAVRAAVELLSVVPGRAPVTLLGPQRPALDEAVLAGLLRVDGSVVEFRHELVRLAVEHELGPARRQDLHAVVLERLERESAAEPAALAYHAWRADRPDLALRCELAAAAKAAGLGAHREAAAHYRRAVSATPGAVRDPAGAGLWLNLSREEYLLGQDEAALDAARHAVSLSGADPSRRAAAIGWLSRVSRPESRQLRLAAEAVELLEPLGPSLALAAAVARLAMIRMVARDLDAAEAAAQQALELAATLTRAGATGAEPVGPADLDPGEGSLAGVEVAALQALGAARTLSGREPGAEHLREAIERARSAGLYDELGRAYANLVSSFGEARLYELAATAGAEALDYFVARDLDGSAAYLRAWLARCRFEQGRWAEAEQLAAAVPAGRAIATLAADCVHGRVRARRGDPDAWPPLDRARELAERTGSLQRIAPVAAARAEARWLAGQPPDDDLRDAYELAASKRNAWAAGELGFWLWRHGRLDALPEFAAEPYRLHAGGDPDAAAAAWTRIGCPYEAADAGADATDEDAVRSALAAFAELGARPGRARAARRLRELGVRSIPRGPRASTGPDGLTAREREVLALVRSGDTDAEIAARLHLSTRTVEHHVSAVLRKTGARSRRDLRDASTPDPAR